MNHKCISIFFILSVLCCNFINNPVWASSNEMSYKHARFTLQGRKSNTENIEVSARNVKISGINTAKKIKISADTITIYAGAKLELEALEVQCKKILIQSAQILSSDFISINADDFKSYGSSWSSPVLSLMVSDQLTIDLKSQIEANYLGFDLGLNGFSNHKIQGKIHRKYFNKLLTSEAKQQALAFCDPDKLESCLEMSSHSEKVQVKIDAKIAGFYSISTQSKANHFNINLSQNSQIKDVGHCSLNGKSLNLSGSIQCEKLSLDGVQRLWMSNSSKIESLILNLVGGEVELNGKIAAEQTSIRFTKNLVLNKLLLKGDKAKIFGNSKLNLNHLSVLDLNQQLEIKSLGKLTLSGETLSKILKISSPSDIKASGKQAAESLKIDSGGKLDISGLVYITEGGQLRVLAENARLRELKVQGAHSKGTTADSILLAVKKDTNISKTRITGFQKGKIKSGKSLTTDPNTYIEIDDLKVYSPEMSLEGEFRSKKITIKGNKISYNGRIIDAKNIEFMGDDSINIGSAAILHVLHSLKLKSNQQISISGELVSQVLEIASPELMLFRTGHLTVQEKVAIYTSLWMKLAGTIDFSQAEATLAATGNLDLDGILKYRNLEIRRANASDPQYSPGQKLVLKLKNRAKLENAKEIVNQWSKQDPEADENELLDTDPEQLLDDETFSQFVQQELKKDHWQKLISHSGKILKFLGHSAWDSVTQTLSSSSLDVLKNGLYQAGVESIVPSLSSKSASCFFETARALGGGDLNSWGRVGKFLAGASHRGFTDFTGLRPGENLEKLGFLGFAGQVLTSKVTNTVYGDLCDPTRIGLDFVQLICTYPFMEEPAFLDRLGKIVLGSHMSTKASILFLLGYEDLADKLMDQGTKNKFNKTNGPRNNRMPKAEDFVQGNLVISADDVLVEGTIEANNIKLKSSRYSQAGKVSTKIALILNEHFELLQGGELSVADQGRIHANIDAIIEGRLLGAQKCLTHSGSQLELSPDLKNTFIEVKANKILSSGIIKLNGDLILKGEGEDSEVILKKDGKVQAAQFSVDAANARIESSVQVEDAFYNIYNEISFDSVDSHVVKNYLKVYAPNTHLKINSKIVAKVIDIASEEFFLMRSGLLSAKEHAVIEAKVHMLMDGVVRAENADLSAKRVDLHRANVRLKESLRIAAEDVRIQNSSRIDASDIQLHANDGDLEIDDSSILAKKVLDIKCNHFSALTKAALEGKNISIRASGKAYLGKMTRLKASTINLKSHWFSQMAQSKMQGSQIQLDTQDFQTMGLIMAENIVASSRLMSLGPKGRMFGGTVSLSTTGLVLAPLSGIAGGRINISSYSTVALSPLSGIAGLQVNIRSPSMILSSASFVVGAKTSIVAPIFLMAPGSLVAGAFGANVNALKAYKSGYNGYKTPIYSLDGNGSLDVLDGFVDGTIGGPEESPFSSVEQGLNSAKEKWKAIKESLASYSLHAQSINDPDKTENNESDKKPDNSSNAEEPATMDRTISSGVKAYGTLVLGKNAKIKGKNSGVLAKNVKGLIGSELNAQHGFIEVAGLADLQTKINGKNITARGIGANAQLILREEGKIRSDNLLRLSNFSKAKIEEGGNLDADVLDAVQMDSFEAQGAWLNIGSKAKVNAKNFAVGGELGERKSEESTKNTGKNQQATDSAPSVSFIQEEGGEYFRYGTQASEGINTKITAQTRLDFQREEGGLIGDGSSLVVDAHNGIKVYEESVVASKSSDYFIGKGRLDLDGLLGKKGGSTRVYGLGLGDAIELQKQALQAKEQGKEASEQSKKNPQGSLIQRKSGSLLGQIEAANLEEACLEGSMTTDQSSTISAQKLHTSRSFNLIVDTNSCDNTTLFQGFDETSMHGQGKTTGPNKTQVIVTHRGKDQAASFGYNHSEDDATIVKVNAQGSTVKFEQSNTQGVGGGRDFKVDAGHLETNGATQHASESVDYDLDKDTVLDGKISTKKPTVKTQGELTNKANERLEVDLRDGGQDAQFHGQNVRFSGVDVENAKGSKIEVGDEKGGTSHASLKDVNVQGDEKTNVNVTGTESAEVEHSRIEGNTDVYSEKGKAVLQGSNVMGDAQVYGAEKTVVEKNGLKGNVRAGYVVSNDGEVTQSKETSFQRNFSLAKNDQQQVSVAGDKVEHGGNRFRQAREVNFVGGSEVDHEGNDYGGNIQNLLKEIVSDNGNTKVHIKYKGLNTDKSGNFTTEGLTVEDRAHNEKIRALADMVSKGFRAKEKAIQYTEARGIAALVEGGDGEVRLEKGNDSGLDKIVIRGQSFVIPKGFTVYVGEFVSYARENHIHGALLQDLTAKFIAENGGFSEQTVFYKGSNVGISGAQTEVRSSEIKIGGKVDGNELNTRSNNITYEDSSERTLEKETNKAEQTINMSGSRTAKTVTDEAQEINYTQGHSTTVRDGGYMEINADQVQQAQGASFYLGNQARLAIGRGFRVETIDSKTVKMQNSAQRVALNGEIKGGIGTKFFLASDYLETHGLIDVEQVFVSVEQLVHEGIFNGANATLLARALDGSGTVDVENELTVSVSKEWKSKHIKLRSGDTLKVYTPSVNGGESFQLQDFDFDLLEAGNAIFITGALDSKYVQELMSGKLEREGHGEINGSELNITTTDPLVILDRNVDVKFNKLDLNCSTFFMEKGSELRTNAFSLSAASLIQASGSIIDSGDNPENNIEIDVNNFSQVYDWDRTEKKLEHIHQGNSGPIAWTPAAIRAGGNLGIHAHIPEEQRQNDKDRGNFLSYGGQFTSRHGNILVKSDGVITIVPITYIDLKTKTKRVGGLMGTFKQKYYSVVQEMVAHRARFNAADRVEIEAGEGTDSYLYDVEFHAPGGKKLTHIEEASQKLYYERHKIGEGLTAEGAAAVTATKVAASVALSAYLGPGVGNVLASAALSGLVNTGIDISVERSKGGMRDKDEWGIARKNGKNAAISAGVRIGFELGADFYKEISAASEAASKSADLADTVIDVSKDLAEKMAKNVVNQGLHSLVHDGKVDWGDLRDCTSEGLGKEILLLGTQAVTSEFLSEPEVDLLNQNGELDLGDAGRAIKNLADQLLTDVADQQLKTGRVDNDRLLENLSNSAVNEFAGAVGQRAGEEARKSFGDCKDWFKNSKDVETPESQFNAPIEEGLPPISEERPGDNSYQNEVQNSDEPNQEIKVKVSEENPEEQKSSLSATDDGNFEKESSQSGVSREDLAQADMQPDGEVEVIDVEQEDFERRLEETNEKVTKLKQKFESEEQRKREFLDTNEETCFSPDTLVLTAKGELIPIGDIKVGDLVLSCNFERCEDMKVTQVHHYGYKEVLDLKTSVGTFTVTPDHPIYHIAEPANISKHNGSTKDAELFKVGDSLLTASFDLAQVSSPISLVRRYSPVVELTIEKNHNFYVVAPSSDQQQDVYSKAILVHNCNEGDLVHPAQDVDQLTALIDGQKKGYEIAVEVYTSVPAAPGIVMAAKEVGKQGAKYGAKAAAKQAGKELAKEGALGAERAAGKKAIHHVKDHKKKVDAGDSNSRIETPHVKVEGGLKKQAPKQGQPNSVYERTAPDGSRHVTYYDEKGRAFSREDYGQKTPHKEMKLGPDGKVVPHEHQTTFSDKGPTGKSYRQLDKDGNPVGPWHND